MKKSKWFIPGFFLSVALTQSLWAAAQSPQPGTINYIEGQATLAGQTLPDTAGGTARLFAGQSLATQNGRAEILLTPGIFLRAGDGSVVEMVSPRLADTVVTVRQGRVLAEVADIRPENNVVINEAGLSVRLQKPGLYDFDATHGTVRVFEGKALVQENGGQKEVGGGHEVNADVSGKLRSTSFEKASYTQDDFYRWASLRSAYVTEANVDAAGRFVQPSGWSTAWAGTGWYWDPWFSAYTFIPGDGVFYSPFGWGFYSPGFVWGAPYFGFWGGGIIGRPRIFGPGYRPRVVADSHFAGHAGRVGGFGGTGFASGRVGAGGGFRAAGGGFHGAPGGGFHGGGFGGGHMGGGAGHR